MKKKTLLVLIALTFILIGCNRNSNSEGKIKIGLSPTPHGQIVEALEEDFKEAGIELEIIYFDDYVKPNLALDEGELDLNFFQHKPYLESFTKEHDLNLASIGTIHIEPLALYSDKYESIEDFPEAAEIIIPNDPSNGARALLLFDKKGLISLKDPEDLNATEEDIIENPHKFKFIPMDAASIARTYKDVDGGVINSNYAIDAGISPINDGIIIEDIESPYANLLVVRSEDKDKEIYKKILEILQSEKSRKFIEEEFKGAIYPAF